MYLPVGVKKQSLLEWNKPFGKVHFAGEHTSPTRWGFVDGAYHTGLRAAKAISENHL